MSDLAVRTVSCKGWRWMPGMLAIPANGLMSRTIRLTDDQDWPHDLGLRLPDLSDPATGGLILQLLAVLCHTQTNVSALSAGVDEWEVWTLRGKSSGPSLGEAAAAALLLLEPTL